MRMADRTLSFKKIHAILAAMGISVSKFVLGKVLKDMKKKRLISTRKRSFRLTKKGKKIRRSKIGKKVSKKRRTMDRKFRNKMRRTARKIARGNRTMEQCVNDCLKRYKKKTMNEMLVLLNKNGIVVSKFVLKKVLERLREKGVLKMPQGHYVRTGKVLRRRKRNKKSKKTSKQ